MTPDKLPAGQPLHSHPVSPSTLLPAQIIQIYSADDWEQFILEWLDGAQPKYHHFDRLGGPGDKGRDIVAYTGPVGTDCKVDVFQCKHYDHPLALSDIWVELGKLCVHTWQNTYPIPRQYRFLSPRGVGTQLHDVLLKPDILRDKLILNWPKHCEKRISSKTSFPLTGSLLTHVNSFDFSIVYYYPPHKILEQHSHTPHWHRRFKRDYPNRPNPSVPPVTPETRELTYVNQLLRAYSEHHGSNLSTVNDLTSAPELKEHFSRSRIEFFVADSLNRFYRDQFPEGAFDDVKKQIFDGVVDTANNTFANGYQRVIATTQQAVQVQLSQTDYVPYVQPGDRKGICHHLVNDNKLKWTKP